MEFYNLSVNETLKKLLVNKEKGLKISDANKRLIKYGKNKISESKHKSFFQKFLEQFSDFMVIVLLIAAAVSFGISIFQKNNEYIDSIIILIIVIINAFMGVVQEEKAEKAIDSLKKMSIPKARVIRSGKEMYIDSEKVVPGDILVLEAGDFVVADCRIIESKNLKSEESSLTGESIAVNKNADKIYSAKISIADRHNMLFASSNIISGHAKAVVTSTGMNTEVGKIAHMINKENSPQTPLQKRLTVTGKILGIGALSICFVIFILGIVQKINPLEMFMISISLAVAAIPEGLPAIVTIVLALGVRRMATKRAVVRKLSAVETLGSTNIICSDKTGTLTQNKMTVTQIATAYSSLKLNSNVSKKILELVSLCNNSSVDSKSENAVGEPTEIALLQAAKSQGVLKSDLEVTYPRLNEIPFDSNRKLMSTIHRIAQGKYRVITKGAPDVLLKKCTNFLDENENVAVFNNLTKKNIELKNNDMAKDALRVIAVAYKDIDTISNNLGSIETKLTFCGLLGMIDLPRPEVKAAVRDCRQAGIKPVMITGDHLDTAKAIASQIGILSKNDKAISGPELQNMSNEDLEKRISEYTVFARVSPEHKVKIVKAFQKNGAVVAMTGDGVNDAPALRAADIGCAMGISGTDVAKNAADMVLTDDNFATIVEAVKQGRGIFENIKRTIRFLLSSNTGEIVTVLAAFLFHMPSPLLAVQLLWVNLVTDSLPALALGVEPVDKNIMKNKPVNKKRNLFADGAGYNIAIEGCFIGSISLLAFSIGRVFFDSLSSGISIARTMCFAVLSLSQVVHSLNVRSEKSLFKVGLFGNKKMILSFIVCAILQVSVISVPFLSNIFRTVPLNFIQWVIVTILSLSPILVVELEKALSTRTKNKKFVGLF